MERERARAKFGHCSQAPRCPVYRCVILVNENTRKYRRSVAVWLGGIVVRALDLQLEIAGLIPAAALSSATLDKLFTHNCPAPLVLRPYGAI